MQLYPEGSVPFSGECINEEQWDTTNAVRIYNISVPSMTVYLPSVNSRTGDAVIICPGGGYLRVVWDKEGEDIAKFWNSKGVAAIIVKYRLPAGCQEKPYMVPLTDVSRALRLTRYHAGEWGIDPDRIGIMGFSAGGHLASTLSTHFDSGNQESSDPVEKMSSRPDFSILIYPVITFTKGFQHSGSREALVGEDPELMKEFSNELHVSSNTPPTFMVHSSDDKAVPVENTLVYYRQLVQNGVPAEVHIFPEGGHGFGLGLTDGHVSEWTELCNIWLKSLKDTK